MNQTFPRPVHRWGASTTGDAGFKPVHDLGRLWVGLVVIAIGTAYLLESADVLDAGTTIGDWWPTAVIALGLAQLAEGKGRVIAPLALMGAGTLLLLVTTDVLGGNVWSWAWPAALVVLGVVALARWAGAGPLPRGGDDVVVATGVFGGPAIASSSTSFRGASLTAVFGGVDLDLRNAHPAPEGARVTATAVFGGIEILVPRGWRVVTTGMPVFGGVEDRTRHDNLPDDAPTLRVDAMSIFGGVAIKHSKDGEGEERG